MPNSICLLTPREGELLHAGILPAGACKYHRHITSAQASLLTGGSDNFPRHDQEYCETGFAGEAVATDSRGQKCAWGEWAALPSEANAEPIAEVEERLIREHAYTPLAVQYALQRLGRLSTRHVILRMAKEWTVSQSWLPIGTERRIKYGRTKLPRPIRYSLTQCRDTNQPQQFSV